MRGANRDDSTRLSEVLPREKLLCYQRNVIAMIIAITITFAMRICQYAVGNRLRNKLKVWGR